MVIVIIIIIIVDISIIMKNIVIISITIVVTNVDNSRRKFRSQTSDNMGRWKAEVGRVREEKRRTKSIKKRKSQKIEDGGVRKGGKSVF